MSDKPIQPITWVDFVKNQQKKITRLKRVKIYPVSERGDLNARSWDRNQIKNHVDTVAFLIFCGSFFYGLIDKNILFFLGVAILFMILGWGHFYTKIRRRVANFFVRKMVWKETLFSGYPHLYEVQENCPLREAWADPEMRALVQHWVSEVGVLTSQHAALIDQWSEQHRMMKTCLALFASNPKAGKQEDRDQAQAYLDEYNQYKREKGADLWADYFKQRHLVDKLHLEKHTPSISQPATVRRL